MRNAANATDRLLLFLAVLLAHVGRTADLPPIGEWDGVTATAKLEGPYEDPKQMNVPFGALRN